MTSREIAVKPVPHGKLARFGAFGRPARSACVGDLPGLGRGDCPPLAQTRCRLATTRREKLIQEICDPSDGIARNLPAGRTDLVWKVRNCKWTLVAIPERKLSARTEPSPLDPP